MSLGVNLLLGLVEQAAAALDAGYDIEIVEMHHRHKVDAPSGTALALGRAAARGRQVALEEAAVRVRDGITGPRQAGTIGFATLRGGDVVGDHRVVFAGAGERLELAHIATDRRIYARGAVHAARWTEGQRAGALRDERRAGAGCGALAGFGRRWQQPLDQPVGAVDIDDRAAAWVDRHAHHPGDEDGVGAGFLGRCDVAVEAGQRVFQNRGAGGERGPASGLEAGLAHHAGAAGETVGELVLLGCQQVDGEAAAGEEQAVGLGLAVDAGQELRRLGRDRADGGGGEAGAGRHLARW